MLEVEPKVVHFNNVLVGQLYTVSLSITNPFPSKIELTLSCSSKKYTLSTTKCVISGHQTQQIYVQLSLHSIPHNHYASSDWLLIKSINFNQKLPMSFSVHNPSHDDKSVNETQLSSIRSMNQSSRSKPVDQSRVDFLEAYIAELELKHPNISDLVNMKVEHACLVFEEKSEKILNILSKKDEQIEVLQRKLGELSHSESVDAYVNGIMEESARQLESAREEFRVERKDHEETMQVLTTMQDEYELLRKENSLLQSQFQAMKERALDQQERIQVPSQLHFDDFCAYIYLCRLFFSSRIVALTMQMSTP